VARHWRRSAAAALHLLALAGAVTAASAAPAAQAGTHSAAAKSAQGWLTGESSGDGGAVFRGVPYAAPPLGSLRWRAPRAPHPWGGRRAASAAAAPCLQADYGWNATDAARSSEDCLYLDVRTPDLHPRRPLPVMVWIHGGSNRAGSAGDTTDSGITRRGVVLVSIQYRLGVFGFLSHPALTREARHQAAGNFGLLDQIAALEWVRHNITAFGGDPRNVTVFGHSAGAEDVGQLLVSPLAHGLFSKAIEQSGSPAFGLPPRSLADNEAIGLQLAHLLGVGTDAAALAALRGRGAHEILAAAETLQSPSLRDPSYLWLQVVVDGRVLPLPPRELLAAGRSNPVALIIGSNTRELTVPGGDAQTDAFLAESFGANDAAARSLYGYMRDGTVPASDAPYGSFSERVSGDVIFRCPAARTAELHATAGYPVWQYQFGRIDSERPFGHAAELPFVFDDLPLGAEQGGPTVSLQAYWVAFAQRGDPNDAALPSWPRYDPSTRAYMDFSATGPQAAGNLGGPICALLDRV
jgi:para-nitrobenzyl esterase